MALRFGYDTGKTLGRALVTRHRVLGLLYGGSGLLFIQETVCPLLQDGSKVTRRHTAVVAKPPLRVAISVGYVMAPSVLPQEHHDRAQVVDLRTLIGVRQREFLAGKPT